MILLNHFPLAATMVDDAGRVLPVDFVWSSTNSAVAAIDAFGNFGARRVGNATISATDRISGESENVPVAVSGNTHFWTASGQELSNLLAVPNGAWVFEGTAWNVFTGNVQFHGVQPLWRFLDLKTNTHFWTLDPNGELFAPGRPHVVNEGITAFVYGSPQPNSRPVYRFYNPNSDEHFWTIFQNELQPGHGFIFEGPVFWAPNFDDPDSAPMHRVRCGACYSLP